MEQKDHSLKGYLSRHSTGVLLNQLALLEKPYLSELDAHTLTVVISILRERGVDLSMVDYKNLIPPPDYYR